MDSRAGAQYSVYSPPTISNSTEDTPKNKGKLINKNKVKKQQADMIDESLKNYVETTILPVYDDFDAAHQRNHVEMVINQSMEIAGNLDVNADMVYAIAAYHDTGMTEGREKHHLASGKIVREDLWLRDWFSEQQIEVIAQACEDHSGFFRP